MSDAQSGSGGTARRRRKDAARNREALIAAGWELFDAHGMAPTLDDVARRAGVGVATAYRHFANKYELARAVLSDSVRDMVAAAELAATREDGWTGLAEFFDAVLRPQAAKRALGDILRDSPEVSPMQDVHIRIETCIDTLLTRARRQGTIRPEVTSTDIGVLCSVMGSLINTFGASDPHLWRRFLPVVLDGLRAQAPTPLPGEALGREQFLARLVRTAP